MKLRTVLVPPAIALASIFATAVAHAEDESTSPSDVAKTKPDAKLPDVPDEYLVTDQDGFLVSYHPATRERVRPVLPLLGEMRKQLSEALGRPVLAEIEIRIAALPVELDRLAPQRSSGAWNLGGATFADKKLIVLTAQSDRDFDVEAALRHHLAHLALLDAAPDTDMPAWFQEGFAVSFSEHDRMSRAEELGRRTLRGDLPSLENLERRDFDPRDAAESADFVRFATTNRTVLPSLVSGLRDGKPFERALETAFASETSQIDRAWRSDITRRYAVFPAIFILSVIALSVWVVRRLRRRAASVKATLEQRRALRRHRRRPRVLSADGVRAREVASSRAEREIIQIEVPKVEHDGSWHTLH